MEFYFFLCWYYQCNSKKIMCYTLQIKLDTCTNLDWIFLNKEKSIYVIFFILYCCFKWKEQENTIYLFFWFIPHTSFFNTSGILNGNFVIACIEKFISKIFRWFYRSAFYFLRWGSFLIMMMYFSNINLMFLFSFLDHLRIISQYYWSHPPTVNFWIFLQLDDFIAHLLFEFEIHNNLWIMWIKVIEILSEAILTSKNFKSNCCAILYWIQNKIQWKRDFFKLKDFLDFNDGSCCVRKKT